MKFAHLFPTVVEARHRAVRTVYLQDLALQMFIGAYHVEKGRKQGVVVNMAVQVAEPDRPIVDALVNVLDYNVLRDAVHRFADAGHTYLQETLCEALADFALGLPDVLAVYVRIGKVEAFSDCAAVGCELLRLRS